MSIWTAFSDSFHDLVSGLFLISCDKWQEGEDAQWRGKRRGVLITDLGAPLQDWALVLIVSGDPLASMAQSKCHSGLQWLCHDHFSQTYSPLPGRQEGSTGLALCNPRDQAGSINPRREPGLRLPGPTPTRAGALSVIYELLHFACYYVPLINEPA